MGVDPSGEMRFCFFAVDLSFSKFTTEPCETFIYLARNTIPPQDLLCMFGGCDPEVQFKLEDCSLSVVIYSIFDLGRKADRRTICVFWAAEILQTFS